MYPVGTRAETEAVPCVVCVWGIWAQGAAQHPPGTAPACRHPGLGAPRWIWAAQKVAKLRQNVEII